MLNFWRKENTTQNRQLNNEIRHIQQQMEKKKKEKNETMTTHLRWTEEYIDGFLGIS